MKKGNTLPLLKPNEVETQQKHCKANTQLFRAKLLSVAQATQDSHLKETQAAAE